MLSDKIVTLKLFADDFERYQEYCTAQGMSLFNGLPFLLDSLNVASAEELREERKEREEREKEQEAAALQNAADAVIRCRNLAEGGDAFAQAELADRYYSGNGVLQDYAQAFFWAEKASAAGVGSADELLGILCFKGCPGEPDFARAHSVFCRLAGTGEPMYQVAAGVCSLLQETEGEEGKPKAENADFQAAVSWFSKAAEQRNALGELMLGFCCASGIGVQQDRERGRVLASRALLRGERLPPGCFILLDDVFPDDDGELEARLEVMDCCSDAVLQYAKRNISSLEPYKNMIYEQVLYSLQHDEELVETLYQVAVNRAEEYIQANSIPLKTAYKIRTETLPEQRYCYAEEVARYIWRVMPRY